MVTTIIGYIFEVFLIFVDIIIFQIVDVNIVTESKNSIEPNAELSFTYEVIWKPSSVEFEKRFEKYLDPSFFQHRVFSDLSNSFLNIFLKLIILKSL